jgi:hypothetical protein
MSDSVAMQIGSVLGYVSMVVMGIGSIVALVNHRKLRSSCCNREVSVSLDIDNTSPKKPEIKI